MHYAHNSTLFQMGGWGWGEGESSKLVLVISVEKLKVLTLFTSTGRQLHHSSDSNVNFTHKFRQAGA